MEMNADAQELRELERELDVEIVPGTEIMTDVNSHHFVKGGGAQVLVPQPSDDQNDPLNWSPFWKTMCITAATMVSFSQNLGPLALGPMFPYLIQDFDSNLKDVVKFTGAGILVMGFSNFIWVPLSTSFGRRPVYILSQVLNIASSIWRARATTYGSFMGACVLNGFSAGPSETIQAAVIADIFFLHDRGFWNTVFWTACATALMISSIISGSMSLHLGWQSYWWFTAGMAALSFLMVVFMFPETKWHRAHPDEHHHTSSPVVPSEKSSDNVGIHQEEKTGDLAQVTRVTTAQDPWLGKGSPGKKQWSLYTPTPNALKAILLDLWIPWKLFAFPIVELASFIVSWSCSSFLLINLTQSQNFAAPPYNYNSQTIGFMNFALLVGTGIGLATAGPLSDWVSARATKKNRGIREPEMRLPAMIPYVIVMIIANFIVAFGYKNSWPWEVIVLVGYTFAGIQAAALPAMASTYAVDSYKPVAGSVMVSITVNKNLWGWGFSEFITPWIMQSGYVPPIMTNMSLVTLWCLCAIPFYYFGKTFRRWTKNDSVHKM